MAAVVWIPTYSAAVAQLALSSGVEAEIGAPLKTRLRVLGLKYDALYTAAVDTAKASSVTLTAAALAAWESTTTVLHEQADEAARYVEDLIGTAGAPLAFTSASDRAIQDRISQAIRRAREDGNVAAAFLENLLTFSAALRTAYAARPAGYVEAHPYDAGEDPFAVGDVPLRGRTIALSNGETFGTVRALETALVAVIATTAAWTAQAAFT